MLAVRSGSGSESIGNRVSMPWGRSLLIVIWAMLVRWGGSLLQGVKSGGLLGAESGRIYGSAGPNACLLGATRAACIETASRVTHVRAHGHRRLRFVGRSPPFSMALLWSPRTRRNQLHEMGGVSRLPSGHLAPSSASSVRMRRGQLRLRQGRP